MWHNSWTNHRPYFCFEQTVTTEVYLQIFNEFVNKLTDDELDITNKTVQHVTLQMRACEKLKVFFLFFFLPPRSPDLTPADFFLWGLLKGKVYKNTPRSIEQLKDAIRREIQAVNVDTLGKVFQNLEKRIQVDWM